jgi:hypothetical protein
MAGEDEEDDEDDEDEDDDDEDDDGDDEEEEPVRPVHRPHTLLDNGDLAALIIRRFSHGWTSMAIFRWLRRKNIASAETKEYLSIRHIGGFKSLMRRRVPSVAVQPETPAPQGIADEERASVLRYLKRLANFIAAKDDPIIKTRALFSIGDSDDRKQGLLLAIIGRERLINAARRLIQEYKGLGEYNLYVLACDSPDGRVWIDTSFDEVKLQAQLSSLLLKKEEAGALLDKLEARMGFPI